MRTLVNITRDLRVRDSATLAAAATMGEVVVVHVIDPGDAARLRLSPRRAAYYCAALSSLASDLAELGARLVVRRGRTGATLRALARAVGAQTVVFAAAYDAKGMRVDRDVQHILEEAGLRVHLVHDAPAIAPDELANGRGYRAFVPYFERWLVHPIGVEFEKPRLHNPEITSEALPQPDEFGSRLPIPRDVSTASAMARFEHFIEGAILGYGTARNVPGDGPTSRLSAELSFGLICARRIVANVRAREGDAFLLVEERLALRAYQRALAQRDFFFQLSYFNDSAEEAPLQEKMRSFAFARAHPMLDAWRAGRTGYPLVDAGIRQLHATGWMHPRVRSIAASFLCFDLGVDWRIGRDEWERFAVEDDPALAVGNWQWVSGVGADLAAFPRIYNPRKQARRFDPTAAYVRTWIPELASLPDRAILDPDGDERAQQLSLALFGDRSYPRPVVEHEREARAFLARYAREVRPTQAVANRPNR